MALRTAYLFKEGKEKKHHSFEVGFFRGVVTDKKLNEFLYDETFAFSTLRLVPHNIAQYSIHHSYDNRFIIRDLIGDFKPYDIDLPELITKYFFVIDKKLFFSIEQDEFH